MFNTISLLVCVCVTCTCSGWVFELSPDCLMKTIESFLSRSSQTRTCPPLSGRTQVSLSSTPVDSVCLMLRLTWLSSLRVVASQSLSEASWRVWVPGCSWSGWWWPSSLCWSTDRGYAKCECSQTHWRSHFTHSSTWCCTSSYKQGLQEHLTFSFN